MTPSGTGLRPLTDDLALASLPSLSRDGRLLLFSRRDPSDGNPDIWMTQADGSGGVNLTGDARGLRW
jgi:hypothetical protein